MVPKRDDPTENIFVFFPDEEKVGVKTIKEYAKRMKDENVFRAVIVVQHSLTPFAKQSLLECQAQKFYIEQFQAGPCIRSRVHLKVPAPAPSRAAPSRCPTATPHWGRVAGCRGGAPGWFASTAVRGEVSLTPL